MQMMSPPRAQTISICRAIKRVILPIFLVVCVCLIGFIYILPYVIASDLLGSLYMSSTHSLEMITNVARHAINEFVRSPSYCTTIPADAYSNISDVSYYNEFPSKINIEQLIHKRTEPLSNIRMCATSNATSYNQHHSILSKLPHNLVRYTNRCQINAINRGQRQFGGLLSGDPLKPLKSTQIGFLHVYKAGGTTVRDTMNNVLPGQSRITWNKYRGHLRQFMSHLFMFSHVRDPITRAISSHFELHRRNVTQVSNNLSGIESFRYMLQVIQSRMHCALANKTKEEKMTDNTIGSIYFNMHIMPQMYFLTEHGNPWKSWPVNYVGNMTELRESVFAILYHFYWRRKRIPRKTAYKKYIANYHHGRNRHNKAYLDGGERRAVVKGNKVLQYQVEMDDLSDADIKKICEIYWMDYICIPFPMPAACNLTELLLQHYGDDVVYKDCWEYNTEEWDKRFVTKYRTKGWDALRNTKQ
eukprot:846222_1